MEVHGGLVGDTLTVEVSAEGEVVATTRVPAPAAGLRVEAEVDLPPPTGAGRLRYSASVRLGGDAFPDDDVAVDYAAVGREEGALVLLSLVPDWEPRYLLPVLREVTGLPTLGYLRAGPDRFVRAGRALDRGDPVDSTTVREAMTDAALVVVHGLGGELDDWTRAVVRQPERRLLLVHDPDGAALVGLSVGPPRPGEWYVSADVPPSPIAGALSGVSLQGLPPLTDVLVAREPEGAAPLLLQLRGAGAPVAALHLADQPSGRVAVSLASGFWRWAAREDGREPYRRLWSGVVGWILADQAVVAAAPRPAEWVVDRGAPVVWSIPPGVGETRIRVSGADSVVVDTVVTGGGRISTGSLPPGPYSFVVGGAASDTVASGRFDVATGTNEMLPAATDPEPGPPSPSLAAGDSRAGRPLRTYPWPYLLVIALLCGEWIGRRRSGLR